MKTLLSLALLASVTACSAANNSSLKDSNSTSASADETPLDGLDYPFGFDRPLVIDAKNFADVARDELGRIFGSLGEGKIVYRDSFTVAASPFISDLARLYYIAKDETILTKKPGLYTAYIISPDGSSMVGFAQYDANTQNISPIFPGYLTGLNENVELSPEEVDAFYAGLKTKFPNLYIQQYSILKSLANIAPGTEGKLVPMDDNSGKTECVALEDLTGDVSHFPACIAKGRQITKENSKDLVAFLEFFATEKRFYLEEDSEFLNPNQKGPAIDLGSGTNSLEIDLNALRTVSIKEIKEGKAIPFTLPSLPAPFGKGRMVNPAVQKLLDQKESDNL